MRHYLAAVMVLCVFIASCSKPPPAVPKDITDLITQNTGMSLCDAAMRYQIGDGVTQDADEAYRLHCLAAEKGNYHSDYQIYSEFRGKDEPETMQQHKEKAIAGYQRLAKKHPDDPEIYWRLAMLHSEGIGVDSSENTIAVNYLRKAAALGHEDARETLPQYTTAR